MSIKFKRGLKIDLPTGELGEPLYCTDTNELYIGQGISNPAQLVQGKLPPILGKNIISIEKTKTVGLVDTYIITYSDKSTFDFTITNGAKGEIGSRGPQGEQGIQGPEGPKGDDGLTVSIKLNGSVFNNSNGIITLPSYPSDTNGGTVDLSLYQTKLDTSLATTSKEIIPAINELKIGQGTLSNEIINVKQEVNEQLDNIILPYDDEIISVNYPAIQTEVDALQSDMSLNKKNILSHDNKFSSLENKINEQFISIQSEKASKNQIVYMKEINKISRDSAISILKSQLKYDETKDTLFEENWNNLSNWATLEGQEIRNNKLVYKSDIPGYNCGANHSFSLSNNENMKAIFKINLNSISGGGVMIGVSDDFPGSKPQSGASSAYGLYFSTNGDVFEMYKTSTLPIAEGIKYTDGDYLITLSVDDVYISIVASKLDGSLELSCRKLRSEFTINNLFVFNSDTSNSYISLISAKKGLQSNGLEQYGKTVQWTGDGTQSFRIYLPKNYDSNSSYPLLICFHGNGTSEINWSSGFGDTNYGQIQRKFTENGYIVLGCSLNENKWSWGNKESTNAYYKAYEYVKNNYSISSVAFFANSMGGIESLNTLSENKIPCQVWIATVPTFNLRDNYNNGFDGVIRSAYGIDSTGSNYDSKTQGRDPNLMNASAFRSVPMLVIYPKDDTAVSSSQNAEKLIEKVKDTSIDLDVVVVPNGMNGHAFNVSDYLGKMIDFANKYVKF